MTSHSTPRLLTHPGTNEVRELLRLRLSDSPGRATLDGGWWPRSRDIAHELADLVDHFPPLIGRVNGTLYARSDWDRHPHTIAVAGGTLNIASLPGDTHMVVLRMSTGTDVRLLVVPPDHRNGEQAMGIAADPSNRWSTAQILAAGAFDDEDTTYDDYWTDGGGAWWDPALEPPSFR